MRIVTAINEWQLLRQQLNSSSLGFIPTMGNLHAGHASLFKRSQCENDMTVVSIFVNPTQFNETKDFEQYPKTLTSDVDLLTSLNIDYLFLPTRQDIYADNYQIQIIENNLSQVLEGEYRPGHFTGMLTVVLKLLNLVLPQRVYFGEKDYQQLLLVKKMVKALFLSIDVLGCPTIRAEDGLALSSRNSRLSSTQRQLAVHFPRLLNSHLSIADIKTELTTLGFIVDYIEEKWQRRLGAVSLDGVRLIDNVSLENKAC